MSPLTEPFLIDPARASGPVLVTGASGCIGSWTVAVLHASGVPVVGCDLRDERTRLSLLIGEDEANAVTWDALDVTDGAAVRALCGARNITAIIHLAGLMIPFCKEDPARGARVNVEGTINVFEAARHHGIKRTAYASSSAIHGMPPGGPTIATLYGAYKLANEYTAKVYWLDWGVPSVGIRPNIVYGVGRDQGMTSEFSVGMAHVAMGAAFQVSYGGPISWLYAGEAAAAFIAAVCQEGSDAPAFDLNGTSMTVEDGLAILSELAPEHRMRTTGIPLPVPADLSDDPIRDHLGDYPSISPSDGIKWTLDAFLHLHGARKLVLR